MTMLLLIAVLMIAGGLMPPLGFFPGRRSAAFD
jgi:hypothetical protein